MDPAFDLPAELDRGVRDADAALRFVSSFTAALGRRVAHDDGCDEGELRAA